MLGRPWGTRNHDLYSLEVLKGHLAVQNETGHMCTLAPSHLLSNAREPHWDSDGHHSVAYLREDVKPPRAYPQGIGSGK